MIKHILHIAFVLFAVVAFGQNSDKPSEKKKQKWKTERKKLKYRKGEKYEGPEDWFGTDPTSMKDEEFKPIFGNGPGGYGSGSGSSGSGGRGSGGYGSGGSGSGGYGSGSGGSGGYGSGSGGSGYRRTGSRGARYNPQQIQRDRQKRYQGYDRGGGSGTLKYDPKVKRPEPIKSSKTSKVQPRPAKLNSSKKSSSGQTSPVWKMLMYILLIAAICVIVYLILRNIKPKNQKIVVDVQNEWNPEIISKTELELKLEAAMERGDYRECVRIYFTFILKELIRKGWIRWKKEKTNHHYVMEMGKQSNALGFMECVRIYDLVWYGDYQIDEDIFEMLKPTLESYYKSLDPIDE